ncbi:MAG TPA: TRAP transporter substrate-binding protein DctP [Roseiflexaceae bacterium]|nr:TRAP transporter substrate-binding protein DctP [Roseiflexaceae bacterium]
MRRRMFLRGVAAGGAALTLGACSTSAPEQPAAQGGTPAPAATAAQAAQPATAAQVAAQPPAQGTELPTLEWNMATSWPPSLDTIFGGAQTVAERVAAMTNGKFKINPRAAGELVPGLEVLNAVEEGAVEMGHTASYYYIGKSPITAFGTALPFGLNAQQQNAWLYEGGGLAKLQELYAAKFNVIQFPAGNTGVQMGGWFRKEINAVADLQGLKMRIPGLGGQVMAKLGVNVQQLPGGEIFQALDAGTIDAAEWVGPYDDTKLGFQNAAEFYYYPGWWEPGPSLEIQIGLDKWNSLPKEYQEVVKSAAFEANVTMLSRYEAKNRIALKELIAGGKTTPKPYSEDILAAAETEAFKIYDEFGAQDPDFKALLDPWKEFRTDVYTWNKINEKSFVDYVYAKI